MRRWSLFALVAVFCLVGVVPASAASGQVVASVTPAYAWVHTGQQVAVSLRIDTSGVSAPDNKLGSFSGTLDWNPAVLAYNGNSGIQAGFAGVVNATKAGTGHIIFNGAKAAGSTGNVTVIVVTFTAVGIGLVSVRPAYQAMAAAATFTNLAPLISVRNGLVAVYR
jgi:hypothetical protein